jgi:hypothetical protein
MEEVSGSAHDVACETRTPPSLPIEVAQMAYAGGTMCRRTRGSFMVPAWRPGRRTMAQDLAKSSSRTRRKQRRALRVDRFGSERTQRNEVLSRKTGRQAKFCRTSDQNFLDAPRATKFIVLKASLQQILAFPPSRPGPRGGADPEASPLDCMENRMRWRHDLRRLKASQEARVDLILEPKARLVSTISSKTCGQLTVASPPSIVHSIKNGLHKITAARNPRGLRQIGELKPKILAGPDISHNLHDHR